MITADFELTEPDALEARLTIKATVYEFRALLKATGDSSEWPLYDFRRTVESVIAAAEKHFYAFGDAPKGGA